MASVFDITKLTAKKHGVAESTMLKATNCGHFYNMVGTVDLDNGSVSVLDVEKYKEDDVFEAAAPKVGDRIVLLLNPVKIYEDTYTEMQNEEYYFNAAGEIIRAYEVVDTDRFSLSVEAFAEDAEPAVGKYVVVDGAGYKLTVVDTNPGASHGFVGKIIDQNANGTYQIFVIKNRPVEA
jgi:hypothetical protein